PVIQRLPPATPEEELIVRIQGAEPVTVHVVDQLEGLPEVSGIEPRPEWVLARPLFTMVRSDVSLVRRSFALAPMPEPPE
ncbi:MAG: hypothetical protein AAF657_35735, partial [Acidobacteriota bacterium]